jgi:hypothetical protein
MIPQFEMIDLQCIIDRLFDEMAAGWRLDGL